jgi:cis-3,4-dihydrophenanthrene-3,4-diol dehydrogenase
MGWLDGRVALVTGGGSGIGRAVVERFVAEGARVGVLDRSAEHLERLTREVDGVVTITGDVTAAGDNDDAVAAVVEAFGGLDTFVGNAGVWDYFATLADTPADRLATSFDELFAVNLKGYLLGAKAALPALLRSDAAGIVFTASNASFLPAGGGPLYTAAKHAVVGLVRELAYELAPHVRVNAVAPGGTLTDLRGLSGLGQQDMSMAGVPNIEQLVAGTAPLGFAQQAADHAGAYVLLASTPNSRAITGQVISSDGGLGVRGLGQAAGGTDLKGSAQ